MNPLQISFESSFDWLLLLQASEALITSLSCDISAEAVAHLGLRDLRLSYAPVDVQLARLSLLCSILTCSPLLKGPLLVVLSRNLLPDVLSMAFPSGHGAGQQASTSDKDSDQKPDKIPNHECGTLYPMASRLGLMGPLTLMGMSCAGALALSAACAQDPGDPYAREGADECLTQILLSGCSPIPVVQHNAAATLSVVASMTEAGLVAQKATELRKLVIDLAAAEAAEGLQSLVTAELSPRRPLPPPSEPQGEPPPPSTLQLQSEVNGAEALGCDPASLLYYTSPALNLKSMACRSASLLPALWQV